MLAKNIKSRLLATQWRPLHEKGRKIGVRNSIASQYETSSYWGYQKDGKVAVIFNLDEDGFSHEVLGKDDMVKVIPREDLIFYTHDPNEKVREIVQKRYKCELPDPVRCDELVQEYYYIENRLDHLYRVLSKYRSLLQSLLYEQFQEKLYYRSVNGRREYPLTPSLITVTMDQYVFRFLWNGKEFEEMEYTFDHEVPNEV